MSGTPGMTRHERFQALLARGAEKKGALAIGTNTKGAADLIVFPPVTATGLLPMLLEVKTVKKSSGSIQLSPAQAVLRESCLQLAHGAVYVVAAMRVEGYRSGTREPFGKVMWEINGAKGSKTWERYEVWLTGVLNDGYSAGAEAFTGKEAPGRAAIDVAGGRPGGLGSRGGPLQGGEVGHPAAAPAGNVTGGPSGARTALWDAPAVQTPREG